MTGMNSIGPEEINRRKIASDIKNDTEELTVEKLGKFNANATAAHKVRCYKDRTEITRLRCATDTSDLEDMLKNIWVTIDNKKPLIVVAFLCVVVN